MTADSDPEFPPVRELSKTQRRVLGVLVEKAFTTPEYYPLTLKAVTAGCNQKSNRDPVINYDEDTVAEALDELRQLGLAAVVHTESGRTERYRHYARKRFPFSEPQLAIMTELLLRGRQQLGELRTRASRMVAIDTQEQLRDELAGLLEQNYIRASGPLERRGVEVDHNLYRPNEAAAITEGVTTVAPVSSRSVGSASSDLDERLGSLEAAQAEFRTELQSLRSELSQLRGEMAELRNALGG